MKIRNEASISILSALRHAKSSVKSIAAFLVIMIILTVFFSSLVILDAKTSDLVNDDINNRKIYISYDDSSLAPNLNNFEHIEYYDYLNETLFCSYPDNSGILIDGNTQYNYTYILGAASTYYADYIIKGTVPAYDNQIVLNYYYLNQCGYYDYAELIGKEFSFFNSSETITFQISGVINTDGSDINYAEAFFNFENAYLFKEMCTVYYYTSVVIEDYKYKDEVLYALQKAFPLLNVAIANSDAEDNLDLLQKQKQLVFTVFASIGALLIVSFIMSLCVLFYKKINRSASFYGTFMAQGGNKKSLFRIILYEISALYFCAFILAQSASLPIVYFLKKLLESQLFMPFRYDGALFIIQAVITLTAGIAICVIIALFSARIFSKQTIADIIKKGGKYD